MLGRLGKVRLLRDLVKVSISLLYSLNMYTHSVDVGRIITYRTVYNLWLQPGPGPPRLDTPMVVISSAAPVVAIAVVVTVSNAHSQ